MDLHKDLEGHPHDDPLEPGMRVLYVITKGEFGGAQTHVLTLLESARDVEKALITGSPGPLTERCTSRGIRHWITPNLNNRIDPLNDIRAISFVRQVIRDIKPDLVHCHSSKAGIVGRIAAWLERTPSVFTAHGWAFSEGAPGLRRVLAVVLERLLARITRMIIVVSRYDLDLAAKYRVGNAYSLRLVHNGIPNCCPIVGRGKGCPTVVMVARFAPPKDQGSLLVAMSKVPSPWKVIFVGDGPMQQSVKDQVRALRLEQCVDFVGARSDVQDILASSSVFCLISQYEGLPISIIEAMRAGLPVVASDVGGVRELVEHGVTGYLVPSQRPELLVSYLSRLISNASLRSQMGTMGRLLYEQGFTSARMVSAVLRVYVECCGSNPMCGRQGDNR